MPITTLEELLALRHRIAEGQAVSREELEEALAFARQSRISAVGPKKTAKEKAPPLDLASLMGMMTQEVKPKP